MDVTIPDAFLIASDQSITVAGVRDEAGELVEDAEFEGTLFDRRGAIIADDLAFTETAAGTYKAELPSEVAAELVEGAVYSLIGVATKAGKKMTMRIKRKARYIEG